MPQLKTLHMGCIALDKETVYTVLKGKLHETMYELNGWLFDYLYANKLPILQLPPLDDFTRSDDDPSMWYIHFPTPEWKIWIKTENVSF